MYMLCIYTYIYIYIYIHGSVSLIPDRPVIGDKIQPCHRWCYLILVLGPTPKKHCLLVARSNPGGVRSLRTRTALRPSRILLGAPGSTFDPEHKLGSRKSGSWHFYSRPRVRQSRAQGQHNTCAMGLVNGAALQICHRRTETGPWVLNFVTAVRA